MSSVATEPKKKGGKATPDEELKFAVAIFRQMLEGGTLPTLDWKVIANEVDPSGTMTANACGIRWLRFRERNGLPTATKKAKDSDDAKVTPKKRAAPKEEGNSAKKAKSTPKKKDGKKIEEGEDEVEHIDELAAKNDFAVRDAGEVEVGGRAEDAEEEFYEA